MIQLRRILFRKAGAVLLLAAAGSSALEAQAVYTQLKDPAQILVFTNVSRALICGCGCHLVLSTCPHVDCPWGIPARRFIENRVREGMTAEQIIDGMVKGFGPEAGKDPIVMMLREQGREDFAVKFENGFGTQVLARTGGFSTSLVFLIFLAAAAALLVFWWKKHPRRKAAEAASAPAARDLLDRTRDLDQ
jgi:hypothetical protein